MELLYIEVCEKEVEKLTDLRALGGLHANV